MDDVWQRMDEQQREWEIAKQQVNDEWQLGRYSDIARAKRWI